MKTFCIYNENDEQLSFPVPANKKSIFEWFSINYQCKKEDIEFIKINKHYHVKLFDRYTFVAK